MKKKNLKNLRLNKKIISNPKNSNATKGGGTHYESICQCPKPIEHPTSNDMCNKTYWGPNCPDW